MKASFGLTMSGLNGWVFKFFNSRLEADHDEKRKLKDDAAELPEEELVSDTKI